MAEYAYSLVEAVQRYDFDPDCDLFYKILIGTITGCSAHYRSCVLLKAS